MRGCNTKIDCKHCAGCETHLREEPVYNYVFLYKGTKRRDEAETLDAFKHKFNPTLWPKVCYYVNHHGQWFNDFYTLTRFEGK